VHPRHGARGLRVQRAVERQYDLHLQSGSAAAQEKPAGTATVLHLRGLVDPERLAQAIREHFKAFDLVEGESEAALALRWEGSPSYERISGFAQGIRRGLANTIAKRMPLYIMVDGDIAQTLGAILRDEMGVDSEILVIDGVVLWDFDYIDLGRIRMPSQTVPVTVKSLVFSEDPRDPQGRARRPHRGHHQVPPG